VEGDDRISLVFNPSDEVLLRLYSSCQIYASCTRWEGLGLPFLEASSFGLANLGFSFFGPAKEVILDGKTGFLADSPSEYRKLLGQLIQEEETRKGFGYAGKEFSREFSWESCARAYKNLLGTL
jgi:glycosyltransferase involved in cell wall biosynthesis